MKKIVVLVLALVLCSAAIGGCSSSSTSVEDTDVSETSAEVADTSAETETEETSAETTSKTIYLINPLIGNTWWGTVETGFYAACEALGYEGISTGPTTGTVEDHLEAMETVLVEKPDAVITIALNPTAYDPILEKYQEAGIPVITFYGDASDTSLRLAYIGCDYDEIGTMEIETIIDAVQEATGEAPMIGVLVGTLDQETHIIRPEIYQEYMDENDIAGEIVAIEATNSDPTTAASLLQSMVLAYPEMNCLISVEGTSGAALGKQYALLDLTEEDLILIVNGDQEEMISAIDDGAYATTTFDAYGAAFKAVEVIDAYLNGEEVESSYIWPGLMVTAENKAEYVEKMGW